MSKPAILMTAELLEMKKSELEAAFEVHRYYNASDRAAMLNEVGDRIFGIAHGAHMLRVDDTIMSQCPNLKIVANFGVGYDGVDCADAQKRGVIVTNTPDVLTEEVADTALGLLIMTVRELGPARDYLMAGRWAREGDYRLTPLSLRERKVGIVGLGRIGKAIARRCEAFGLPIAYFGRNKQDVPYTYHADMVELAAATDTLIVVTPGTADTQNLINKDVLKALGPDGVIVNVARGSVVDEPALMTALKGGTIAAAGLDVMVGEPKINPELMTIPNLTLLPHVGSASKHTRNKMGQLVVDNLLACANNQAPITPVAETPFSEW